MRIAMPIAMPIASRFDLVDVSTSSMTGRLDVRR